MYLKADLRSFDLKDLGGKFDVILVEPPLEEYQRSLGVTNVDFFSWDQVVFQFVVHVHIYFICCSVLDYGTGHRRNCCS